MPTVEPKEEFRRLTEAEVRAALDDPDPANPVAIEVERLIEQYTAPEGSEPDEHLQECIGQVKRLSPIEAFALRSLIEGLRRENDEKELELAALQKALDDAEAAGIQVPRRN